ncbi:MAG TPA: tocopherol cyclase family protein [Thermoleophilaceae bacterium]|nr:tocopherol cyclase family protein [Thermoleophilaceae bacterium]
MIRASLLDAYRRTGADPPFGDPARAHGTPLEGYYWRIVDPEAGRVIVALCGVCRPGAESWATVAVAAHPGGFLRHAMVAPAAGEREAFGVRAGGGPCGSAEALGVRGSAEALGVGRSAGAFSVRRGDGVLRGSADALSVRLGDDVRVELRLRSPFLWPNRAFGGLGPAHAVPGLGQYWHPVVLAARADGEASLGGVDVRFHGATAYVEKNWGPGFARHWWWGQAGAFPGADATVAFAGGRLRVAGQVVAPTAVVVRIGERVLRFAPPVARVRTAATASAWRVIARTARHAAEIEGDAAGATPHVLPVPDIAARRVEMRSSQHLAGRLRLRVSRGTRTLFEGASPLAGLELGEP